MGCILNFFAIVFVVVAISVILQPFALPILIIAAVLLLLSWFGGDKK